MNDMSPDVINLRKPMRELYTTNLSRLSKEKSGVW